jgi:hypothetical protein
MASEMNIDRRLLNVFMPQQLLDMMDIRAGLKKMGRKAVP